MSSYSRQQLESWISKIEVNGGKVLDIGNSQLKICKRLKSFECDEYVGLDLENPHEGEKSDIVCDLNECLYDIEQRKPEDGYCRLHGIMPKLSLQDYTLEYSKMFDIVFCLEVSEYWWDPATALRNINWFLKKGGILYLSTHFQYPCHQPLKDDCLRYTISGIEKLLKETGFEIEDMQPRLLSEVGQNIYNDLISVEKMRPAKNYDKHGWSGALIRARKI